MKGICQLWDLSNDNCGLITGKSDSFRKVDRVESFEDKSDYLTNNEYELMSGKSGEAFCNFCRKTSPINGMFYDRKTDTYYHEGCISYHGKYDKLENENKSDLSRLNKKDDEKSYQQIKSQVVDDLDSIFETKEELMILHSLSQKSYKELKELGNIPDGFTETGLRVYKTFLERIEYMLESDQDL